MQIAWGGTRFVILCGDRAYKVARIRPFRILRQLVVHSLRGEVSHKLRRFGDAKMSAGFKYVLGGIIANKDEFCNWSRHQTYDLARVVSVHFGGLLLIQEKGEPISGDEAPLAHRLWGSVLAAENGNVSQAVAQFARFGNTIKLIDFGDRVHSL